MANRKFYRDHGLVFAKEWAERLGQKGVEITMNVYVHALPDMQEEAEAVFGSILNA
jgi:hypothetical protein